MQIKEKIKEVKEHEVSQQKLLRKGTLLDDKSTVADIGIQEGEFLVVMVNAKVWMFKYIFSIRSLHNKCHHQSNNQFQFNSQHINSQHNNPCNPLYNQQGLSISVELPN